MINYGASNEQGKEIDVHIPSSEKTKSEDSSDGISRFRTALPQILASTAKNLILMDLGMTIAFPTIVIPALLSNKTGIGMSFSTSEASWFGSIAFICQPLGSILSGIVLEPLGRKCSLLIVNFPHIVGWLTFYYATTIRTVFIANVILGLGVGFMEAPIITYVGEICEPSLRGILISYSGLFFSFGMVITTGIGNLTDWQTTALISTLVPIITILAITQVPETPYWLLSRGRYSDAEKSLCWLRGWVEPHVVQKEFQEMIRYSDAAKYNRNSKQDSKKELKEPKSAYSNPVSIDDEKLKQNSGKEKEHNSINTICDKVTSENTMGNEFVAVDLSSKDNEINKKSDKVVNNVNNNKIKENSSDDKMSFMERCKDLTRPGMLKPLALVLGFFFVINFAGISAMRPYQVKVYQDLGFPIDPYRAMVVMSINAFVGTVLCMVFVRYLGKRLLTLISLSVVATAVYSLSLYAKFNGSGLGGHVPEHNWLPFIIFFIMQFFFSFGVAPVPWMLVSEVFPYRGRSQASGFSAACSYIFSFTATKTFLGLESTLSLSGVLFLYGTCCFFGFIGMYVFLPETEGRTLEEIEDSYSSGKKR